MSKHIIKVGVEEQQFNELAHIAKSIGLSPTEAARFAVHSFLLSVKMSSIKLFMDDHTKLDEIGMEALKTLYKIDVEDSNEVQK